MIADTHVDVDVAQILFAASAIVVALGIPSVIAARSSRRSAKASEKVVEEVDTGNGKKLGAAIHEIHQTVEVLSAQVHTNTKETLELSEKVDTHLEDFEMLNEKLDGHIEESTKVHERLLGELDLEDRREGADDRREGG